jgi:WD40 repeat protein/DNA-binding SARP family transcriptional activator
LCLKSGWIKVARLSISLLGSFHVTLGGEPLSGFESDKVRALLAFLAVECDRPHRRERLAALLWPDIPESNARTNLRSALANLRQVFADHLADPPFLIINRQAVQFNRASDHLLDVTVFTAILGNVDTDYLVVDRLEKAVSLYRGGFLEGLALKDSPIFDEWSLLTREHLARQMVSALRRLAVYHEGRSDYKRGIRYASRWVELEPWNEEGHRQLMRLLALDGQRSVALAQFQTSRKALAEELGVEPSKETTALYERIRIGELGLEPAAPRDWVVRGYELRERLGAGSSGAVYRAHQPLVGRDVAIKIILPQLANQPPFIRRFEAEAQLVAQLEHPHIVPLYDYWREPDGAFLVMRWMRGGSLQDSLKQDSWKVGAVAQFIDQVGAALRVAHRQGVVHRDIKPANILLDEEDNAYLSDFGIVREVTIESGAAQPEVTTGTPGYLSPEQIRGEIVTPRTDIYSLGVVIYELLTGEQPFAGESTTTILEKHIRDPLPQITVLRTGLPVGLDEILQRATAKDPGDRYPDVDSMMADFHHVLQPEAYLPGVISTVVADLEIRNPYKGLRPFQEADAPDFFGREALIQALLDRWTPSPLRDGTEDRRSGDVPGEAGFPSKELGEVRFLAMVGPSGSGKSSAVKAGLIPALRQGSLPGSESWFITDMLPGTHPMDELETALMRVAVNPPDRLDAMLREGESGLLSAIERCLPIDSELLLLVDQFEELFTLVEDPDESRQFLRILLAAVTDPDSRLRLMVTLRADFYDRPLQISGFGELIRSHTEVVLPLSPEELEQSIVRPANRVGVRLEPGLVSQIVTDVTDQPGYLPLMQYALTELFERRQGNTLTMAAYRESGGVLGALGRRAEKIYAGLDAMGQAATRQIFLRLVTLGEGASDGSTSSDTRRRVMRSELEAMTNFGVSETSARAAGKTVGVSSQPFVAHEVLDRFGKYRLLIFDRHPETRAPTVEVAHEALLREWVRLWGWIEESREELRAHRRLTANAAEWANADRDPGLLLRGTRLNRFESWSTETNLALSPMEDEYLEASLTARRERETAEEARIARERVLEQRSRNFLWSMVVVFAIATVVAFVLAAFGLNRSQLADRNAATATFAQGLALNEAATATISQGEAQLQAARAATAAADARSQQALAEAEAQARTTQQAIAQEQARLASARELASASIANLGVDPELSIMLALQAVEETYIEAGTVLREVEEALHEAVQASRTQITLTENNGVAFSPDGTRFATAGMGNIAKLWDTATGIELLTLSGHTEEVINLAFNPTGDQLVTTSLDGTARVWDAKTGEVLLTLTGHTAGLISPAFSPDGTLIATTSFDSTARVWDAAIGQELLTLPHSSVTVGIDFSPDGRRLAVADLEARVVRVWDMASGQEVLTLAGHTDDVNDVVFSPDGKLLATASSDGTGKVWDRITGRELVTFFGHNGWVFGVDFSSDGKFVATGGQDGIARIWDAKTGEQLLVLPGHGGGIGNVAFSPDGQLLVSGGEGRTKIWDVTPAGSREWLTLPGHTDLVFSLAFSPDGDRLASASWDGTARIRDATSGENLLELAAHTAEVTRIVFSPNGDRLATASYDGTAKIWEAFTGEELLTLDPDGGIVYGIAFSMDGENLSTAMEDGTVKMWNVRSGEELLVMKGHDGLVFRVTFSPDGKRIATASWDGTAKIWDSHSGQLLLDLQAHEGGVNQIAWHPDGGRIATAGFDGTAKLWEATSGKELLTLTGHSTIVWDVAFSPDASRLATLAFDGKMRIWDTHTGAELLTFSGLTGPEVAFSPDGKFLAAAGRDNTVRIFVMPLEILVELAQARLTRWFTEQECNRYLYSDSCPTIP